MAAKNEKGNSTADREITITRLLNAPRELVFELWTKPEHIKHWWGPTGFTNTISKMDVRPGGNWEFVMHGPDGTDFKNHNVFEEIIWPEKIVSQHASGPNFKMTITFTAQGEKTLLNIVSLFESAEQLKEVIRVFKADEGLKQNVDRLESYISNLPQNAGEPLVIERTYNAPIEKIWKAITDINEMKKWYFALSEFRPEEGFEFEFSKDKDGQIYRHLFKVTEVVTGSKISYSWRYDCYSGNSLVTWELFAEGEKTRLKLTHTGLETFPAENPDLAKHNFVAGWTHMVGTALKEFVEPVN